jgi:N-acetylmuramic acid 6-phosphate etherase
MTLEHLTTEGRNPSSSEIDRLSAREIVMLMNDEDTRIADAVRAEADAIAQAIEVIAERLRGGGRLVYMGAGTSGRLGVLDASECPPTFNSPREQVVGLIAGGHKALTRSIEGAEDDPATGRGDLERIAFTANDVLVGIATSGRTPYVLGALAYARELGAPTIGLCCNRDSELERLSEISIVPVVGPEVVSGSTRLKAGTATKMVLNMLSTGAMVALGKTYGNLMVDLQAKNQKLLERSRRIVATLTGLTVDEAQAQLARCLGDVKTAVVAQQRGLDPQAARELLNKHDGHLRGALEDEGLP